MAWSRDWVGFFGELIDGENCFGNNCFWVSGGESFLKMGIGKKLIEWMDGNWDRK